MSEPVRLRLSRRKGFDLQAESMALNGLPAAKVDRATGWGNPYRPGDELGFGPLAGTTIRDRAHAVEIYELWAQFAVAGMARASDLSGEAPSASTVASRLATLRGKNLACWCPLPVSGEPDHCHAAVLLRLANVCCEAPPSPNAGDGTQAPTHPDREGKGGER